MSRIFEQEFSDLQARTHAVSKEHGFQEQSGNPLYVPAALGLIGTEVSEALEAHRTGKDSQVGYELADIVIRTMDLAQALNINLAVAITEKHRINSRRTYKHGDKRY